MDLAYSSCIDFVHKAVYVYEALPVSCMRFVAAMIKNPGSVTLAHCKSVHLYSGNACCVLLSFIVVKSQKHLCGSIHDDIHFFFCNVSTRSHLVCDNIRHDGIFWNE